MDEKVGAGAGYGMGLIPEKFDYGTFVTKLLTEQIAGFYDHTRQELHIADWLLPLCKSGDGRKFFMRSKTRNGARSCLIEKV